MKNYLLLTQHLRTFYLLFSLVAINLSTSAQVDFSNYLEEGTYAFTDSFKLLRSEMFTSYGSQFGLTEDDEMELVDEDYIRMDSTDSLDYGSVHSKFVQKHKGYYVENRQMNVISKCGVVLIANGSLAQDLSIDDSDLMVEEDALDSLMSYFSPTLGFTWEDEDYENSLIDLTEDSLGNFDSSVTSYPVGELTVALKYGDDIEDIATNYDLCWKFQITYFDTIRHDSILHDTSWVYNALDTVVFTRKIYISATGGEVWRDENPVQGWKYVNGNVWTWYNGQRWDILTRTCNLCRNYVLQDETRKVTAKWVKNTNPNLVRASNNSWVGGWMEQEPATAYWGVQRAYDYFKQMGGSFNTRIGIYTNSRMSSLGTQYIPPKVYGYSGANHSDHQIIVPPGFGALSWASLEAMGHEVTHVLNFERGQVGVGWKETYESRAINEGFADIFGLLTETWVNNWCDWTVLDDGFWGKFERSFHDPQNDVHPNGTNSSATYADLHNSTWTGYLPYSSSGPLRKWFNHLSQGEWNWSPAYSGVGLTDAGNISFLTFYYVIHNQTGYWNLRHASLAVAAMHYGGVCSPVWKKVERAWADVGVGSTSACKPFKLRTIKVASETQVGSVERPILFGVAQFDEADHIIQGYDWIVPDHWEVTLSNGDATLEVDDVDNNFSSQPITVIVEYLEEFTGDTTFDTLTSYLHFSIECNDESLSAPPSDPFSSVKQMLSPHAQNASLGVLVYPNPVTDILTLENLNADYHVELYNSNGALIFSGVSERKNETIDMGELPQGIYLLQIFDHKGGTQINKLLKE